MNQKSDTDKSKYKIHLESDIHDTLYELDADVCDIFEDNKNRLKNDRTLYRYYNSRSTLTEEERDKLGRKEMINFGDSFDNAQAFSVPIESMVLNNDRLPKITFKTGDLEKDVMLSLSASNHMAELAFNGPDKFDNFWRTVGGWCFLRAGGPALWDSDDYGLYPRFSDTMLFPTGASLESDEQTRCVEELNLDLYDLMQYKKTATDAKTKRKIQELIDKLRKYVQYGTGDAGTYNEVKDTVSARKHDIGDVLTAWRYWEVRCKENGEKYVSSITYTDYQVEKSESDDTQGSYTILEQEEMAVKDPNMWMVMIVVDEEVGGNKTIDTMRGLGEAGYEPSVARDTLKNRQYEGGLMAARPIIYNDTGKTEEILSFDPTSEYVGPKGIGFYEIPDTSKALDRTISYLDNGLSSISRSDRSNSNRGGELLVQANQRDRTTQTIVTNRINKLGKQLIRIVSIMYRRLMTLDLSGGKGTPDYNIIKSFQDRFDRDIILIYGLKEEGNSIDGSDKKLMSEAAKIRKKLATEDYSYPKYYTVSIDKNATGIDRVSEEETGKIILDAVQAGIIRAEAAGPMTKIALTLLTANPTIAREAFGDFTVKDKDQRFTARSEWGHIKNLALAGEQARVEISDNDVDFIHVDEHINMGIADINLHGLDPWTQDKIIQFTAGSEHIMAHINRMGSEPSGRGQAQTLLQEWQNVLKQFAIIVQEVTQQQQQQVEQNDPDVELKRAKTAKVLLEMQIMAEKHGLDIKESERLDMQTRLRQFGQEETRQLARRKTSTKEILDFEKLEIQKQELRLKSNGGN